MVYYWKKLKYHFPYFRGGVSESMEISIFFFNLSLKVSSIIFFNLSLKEVSSIIGKSQNNRNFNLVSIFRPPRCLLLHSTPRPRQTAVGGTWRISPRLSLVMVTPAARWWWWRGGSPPNFDSCLDLQCITYRTESNRTKTKQSQW